MTKKKNTNIKPIVYEYKIQVNRIMEHNILCFEVDKYRYIFCARMEFTRHVPEFVVRNIEKIEIVEKFFAKFLGTIFIEHDINYLYSKGIFYYYLRDDYFVD